MSPGAATGCFVASALAFGATVAPAAPTWRLELIDTVRHADTLEIDGETWRLEDNERPREPLRQADILHVERVSHESPPRTNPFERRGSATLHGGGVRFTDFSVAEDRLILHGVTGVRGAYTIPIDALRDFLLPAIDVDGAEAERRRAILRETVAATVADVLLLVGRDDPLAEPTPVEGLVESIEAEGVAFRFGEQRGVVRWAKLVGFGLSDLASQSSPQPAFGDERAPSVVVETTAGDRLIGESLRTQGASFVLAGPFDEVRLPRDLVRSIDLRSRKMACARAWRLLEGRWLDGDTGEWRAATRGGADGDAWIGSRRVLAFDRALAGGPLRSGAVTANAPPNPLSDRPGNEASRGMAVRGPCRLEFALPEVAARLKSRVAIDPAADGDTVVRVLLDRDEVWSERLRSGEAPRVIDLPLAGATRLTLIVEQGERADVGDRVHFTNLCVVR